MSYHITHWLGDSESSPGTDRFGELFDELALADDEHPDVFVTHESGWSLGVNRKGRAYWENIEDDSAAPRHLESVSREKFIELATSIAAGEFATIEGEDWEPGY